MRVDGMEEQGRLAEALREAKKKRRELEGPLRRALGSKGDEILREHDEKLVELAEHESEFDRLSWQLESLQDAAHRELPSFDTDGTAISVYVEKIIEVSCEAREHCLWSLALKAQQARVS